ncbi:hypothetical protein GCM10011371_19830 [Novosphingobium marinum]|uniref:Sulfide:quinone oxidoreductase n=1 Tax=Novosphingobium marinum TaxID=1514948 RepID=A0A7Z0BTK1_9SPHN|nr:bifunctional protein tyrosine phosphatase family protein/NAD(P)/FAD-dependent oxidoreductase [Novosphingobium marinum]NYH96096.1 sulfide:quinone oxidoreductase [Novosphingobium marinum]GGC32446.1 hypothetical protein GCM10011371_19830 [Novosphingobium marinum]
MQIDFVTPRLAVAGQLGLDDIAALEENGFRSLICNRPDDEEPGQPAWSAIEAAAKAAGLETRYIPVGGGMTAELQAGAFADALSGLPEPVLAFCRTGNRSRQLAELVRSAPIGPGGTARHSVVIVGGGSAGIATAASMIRRRPGLDIAIVEPSAVHFYQPGWTMVGGGVFTLDQTARPMAEVMPGGVKWIRSGAAGFDPENKTVHLDGGGEVGYDVLVVAVGNRLAWEEITGLEEALGRNGVTSNYRYDLAPYTWRLVQQIKSGRALFTQPPMPIKCAGAPQKAMYLSCSEWEKAGHLGSIEVEFHNAGSVLFGVPDYVPALMETVDRYGIGLNFGSNLVAVDGPAREATFRTESGEVTRRFDMLHVCPPQKGHPLVAASDLADEAGYVDIDQATMRHTRYPDVFALGDCGNTANAKTAAAARKQAPVVAVNVLAALAGREPEAGYDGYGSCPLTVERGKIVLAEFAYGGKVSPTLPKWLINGTKPSRLAWHLKADALPPIYWHGMLKGREWLVNPMPLY